jgi:hypothetical protein
VLRERRLWLRLREGEKSSWGKGIEFEDFLCLLGILGAHTNMCAIEYVFTHSL